MLMTDNASAQVTCPPSTVSGTTPLPGCVQLIQQTAPGAQGAIFGAQGVATQSNQAAMDRLSEVRNAIGGTTPPTGTIPLSFSEPPVDWATAYAKARKAKDPISPVLKAPPPPPAPTIRPAAWLRAYGDLENRDANLVTVATLAGVPLTFDQAYKQRTGGLLGGVDFVMSGITSANDALILGALGGYNASNITFNTGTHHLSAGRVGSFMAPTSTAASSSTRWSRAISCRSIRRCLLPLRPM